MKKILLTVFIIILSALLTSCTGQSANTGFSVSFTDVFDTLTQFTAYCPDKRTFDAAAEAVHAELVELHKKFDIYNEYDGIKNLAYINRTAYDAPVELDEDVKELLLLGIKYNKLSSGKLNIASGAVLSIWHKYREEGVSVPGISALAEAAEHIDINSVIIENNTVRFTDVKVRLDVGAVAKGYAADKAASVAYVSGLDSFALNIGGNVVTSGKKPNGKWSVGIQSPDGGIAKTVRVSDLSVVTSGDYQRFYEVDGVRYHHIIDPDTLFPSASFCSVTVICASSSDADALSTALFCMTYEDGAELARSVGAEAMWIRPDGTVLETEGFSHYE